jgi:segregation and condensation protein B
LNSARKELSTSINPNPTQILELASAQKTEDAFLEKLVDVESVKVDSPLNKTPKRRSAPDVRPPAIELPKPKLYPRRRPPRLPANPALLKPDSEIKQNVPNPVTVNTEQSREGQVQTKRIVEAILFAADKPMTVKQIQQVFPELEQPDTLQIQEAIESITQDYITRPIVLKKLASGYRFQVREGMAYWVSRLFEEKPPRYSRALLETIAIIAYRQPVTRGEIEDIRGVAVSSSIIHSLLEREWIHVVAHKEVPGRPALYGTTKQFLDYFNLTTLQELPTLQELVNMDFNNSLMQQDQQVNSERPQIEQSEAVQDHVEQQQIE